MVDFKKLIKETRNTDLGDLIAVFDSLDRRTSHTDLRPAQEEALQLLSARREDRDIVLKISTGAGKTAAGLLWLFSFMEEYKEPALYLCPTRQLCRQVSDESEKLGIESTLYLGGDTYPDVQGIRAKAVIICTYDKLFNAQSTFDRTDVMLRPRAIVCDDAHAGVEEVRDSFTVRISGDELHKELLKLLDTVCRGHNAPLWQDILNEDPEAILDVPCWVWQPLQAQAGALLADFSKVGSYRFVMSHILDVLRWCRCVVSGKGIEIVPDILPVHKNEAFNDASHRLFMSATLADDSVLVRELDCDVDAARNPLMPAQDKGLGERMVLAPSLVAKEFDRAWVMKTCSWLAKKVNVVVLSPSNPQAQEWEDFGATFHSGDDVAAAIDGLRQSKKGNFVVFVQRYDGIDLPDHSCRVLIIDGMPTGEGMVDKYDSRLTRLVGGARSKLIYRIEQGMGRAVRSHADYAVVLLAGPGLAHFIAKKDVLASMNPDTRAQLRLAVDLAKLAAEEEGDGVESAIVDLIEKCLMRDEGWKQFHNDAMRETEKSAAGFAEDHRLDMAAAERSAFTAALSNNLPEAVSLLRNAINDYVSDIPSSKGWYLQRVANYLYDLNQGEALEVQRAAYENNNCMICPPAVVVRPATGNNVSVQARVHEWFQQFANPNGAIAAIQDLRARLSFAMSVNTIEQAICDLAALLGAKGSRPERDFGKGPDDMWMWPDLALVIEAKTNNENSIHKRDAGQMLLSLRWFDKNYQTMNARIPLVVAKVTLCDKDADFPDETRVITPDLIEQLLTTLENFFGRLIGEPLLHSNPKAVRQLQNEMGLLPEQFRARYTLAPDRKTS